jgi:hypothetical protein
MRTLARDSDVMVRRELAGNPVTAPAVLSELADDPDGVVRMVVAGHPAAPRTALEVLAEDRNTGVARVASKALDTHRRTARGWSRKE